MGYAGQCRSCAKSDKHMETAARLDGSDPRRPLGHVGG